MTVERWQQIEQLYHAALECEINARAAFLNEACAGDDELHDEVEALLAANEQATGFLGTPALEQEAKEIASEKITARLTPVIGNSLNHYTVLSRIGAGGMGEVWLARDTRLDRQVALKMLPVEFTADAHRLQRFILEAKAASALNHPNIITIHEIGEALTANGKTHFIATEFIAGQTLRQRMAENEWRQREAIDAAIQVAAALDAAHNAGIVHRDIKPENIMVRPDGLVKVLDFGLAKLASPSGQSSDAVNTNSETLPPALKTQPGMILGTLRYMSPEQARGREVDARTDIFSLGVVIYEMLTRQPLFAGDNSADVIAAIIHKDPSPLTDLAPDTPAELERIVSKALAKDCRDRYQTARDLQIDLQNLRQDISFQSQLTRSGQSALRNPSNIAPQPKFKQWPIIAATLLVGLIVVFAVWKFRLPSPKTPSRSAPRISQLVNVKISSGEGVSRITFSPDGKLIAWSSSSGEEGHIWTKQLVGGGERKITDGRWRDRRPIWSPDGQQLTFISDRDGTPGIWSVPYFGGTPTLIKAIDLNSGYLIGWLKNKTGETIYYEMTPNLYGLELASGQTTQLTSFDSQHSSARSFRVSPDGSQITYSDLVNGKWHIFMLPLQGKIPTQLTHGEGNNRFPAWLPDGKRIAFVSNRKGSYQIYLAGIDGGEPEQMTFSDSEYSYLDVSPDGEKIISISEKENANIFSCDIRTGLEVGHTSNFGLQLFPEVSINGEKIAYQSPSTSLKMDDAIFLKPASADDQPVELVPAGFDAKWAPDGETLAFLRSSAGKTNLWKVSASSVNQKQLTTGGVLLSVMTGSPYNRVATNYNWSPDGSKLAYASGKSGQWNLWVVDNDGTNETMISGNADPQIKATSPFWSPQANRLAYVLEPFAYSATDKTTRTLCVTEQGKTVTVFESPVPIRIIGWAASGQAVYVAQGERKSPTFPQQVSLLSVSLDGKQVKTLARASAVYLHNIKVSRDGRNIAFVSREDGKDNIRVVSSDGGPSRKITQNTDPTIYYSGLTWPPDGKSLFYCRQSSWAVALLIENFK